MIWSRGMVRTVFGVLCLVGLTASCSRNETAKTPRGTAFQGKNYVLENVHDWEEKRSQMRTDRMWLSPLEGSNDTFRENVNVTVENIPTGMKIDEYIEKGMEDLNAMGISAPANYEPIRINGIAASMAHINYAIGTVKLVLDSYVLLDGNQAYVISCTATEETYEMYGPQFEAMIETFSL